MTLRVFRAIGWSAACLLLGAAVCAAPAASDPGPAGARRMDVSRGGQRSTSIVGAAWHANDSPIPKARLRLRDARTGRVVATTVANDAGQFSFAGVEAGTYIIELVSERGKVLTLGHPFTIAPGETVATFIRLGTRLAWFDGFFSNVAAAASSIAASTGITAIAPGAVRPVSAQK